MPKTKTKYHCEVCDAEFDLEAGAVSCELGHADYRLAQNLIENFSRDIQEGNVFLKWHKYTSTGGYLPEVLKITGVSLGAYRKNEFTVTAVRFPESFSQKNLSERVWLTETFRFHADNRSNLVEKLDALMESDHGGTVYLEPAHKLTDDRFSLLCDVDREMMIRSLQVVADDANQMIAALRGKSESV
jgi:hypothetical protein